MLYDVLLVLAIWLFTLFPFVAAANDAVAGAAMQSLLFVEMFSFFAYFWVARGQTLVVLEAMKIQHQLKAALDAKVESVSVQEGQQVANRTVLVTMASDAAAR